MNDEERRVITSFVERIAGAQQQGWGDKRANTQGAGKKAAALQHQGASRLW